MTVLLVAGIAVMLAGLLAIAFGIPVKEFGFGNTLILTGTIGACTGLILLSLALVVREMKALGRRLASSDEATVPQPLRELKLPPTPVDEPLVDSAPELDRDGAFFSRDQPSAPKSERSAAADPASPPWQEEIVRDRERARNVAPPVEEPVAEAKPRRNLLFSSSSRKERERAAAIQPEPAPAEPIVPEPSDHDSASPAAPTLFEDAWPQSERARADAQRRTQRPPATFADSPPVAAPAPAPVTVLKSGVVDGMAYSLYSDGSIEAQMPEGMMRFASIDELREHLDHRV